jgi:hypothetical protein
MIMDNNGTHKTPLSWFAELTTTQLRRGVYRGVA